MRHEQFHRFGGEVHRVVRGELEGGSVAGGAGDGQCEAAKRLIAGSEDGLEAGEAAGDAGTALYRGRGRREREACPDLQGVRDDESISFGGLEWGDDRQPASSAGGGEGALTGAGNTCPDVEASPGADEHRKGNGRSLIVGEARFEPVEVDEEVVGAVNRDMRCRAAAENGGCLLEGVEAVAGVGANREESRAAAAGCRDEHPAFDAGG